MEKWKQRWAAGLKPSCPRDCSSRSLHNAKKSCSAWWVRDQGASRGKGISKHPNKEHRNATALLNAVTTDCDKGQRVINSGPHSNSCWQATSGWKRQSMWLKCVFTSYMSINWAHTYIKYLSLVLPCCSLTSSSPFSSATNHECTQKHCQYRSNAKPGV